MFHLSCDGWGPTASSALPLRTDRFLLLWAVFLHYVHRHCGSIAMLSKRSRRRLKDITRPIVSQSCNAYGPVELVHCNQNVGLL